MKLGKSRLHIGDPGPRKSFYLSDGDITPPPAAPVATAATNINYYSFQANWSASAGATGYLLDVATDADFTFFVPGFENFDVGNVLFQNVTGLDWNTSYYYRLRAYNADGTSSNSNVITTSTLQFVGLLDEISGAALGCSVRLLKSNYTGGLIRVIAYNPIELSTHGAADIMPYQIGAEFFVDMNSNLANLDATATARGLTTSSTLSDLCGVGVNNYDGLVTKIFDQSGNNNYAEQTTLSNMRKIVIAGSLNFEGSFAAIDGLNYLMQNDISINDFTVISITKKANTTNRESVILGNIVGNSYYGDDTDSLGNPIFYGGGGQIVSKNIANSAAASGAETTYHISGAKRISSTANSIFNEINSGNATVNVNSLIINKLGYFDNSSTYNYIGNVQEIILWPNGEDYDTIRTHVNAVYSIY